MNERLFHKPIGRKHIHKHTRTKMRAHTHTHRKICQIISLN